MIRSFRKITKESGKSDQRRSPIFDSSSSTVICAIAVFFFLVLFTFTERCHRLKRSKLITLHFLLSFSLYIMYGIILIYIVGVLPPFLSSFAPRIRHQLRSHATQDAVGRLGRKYYRFNDCWRNLAQYTTNGTRYTFLFMLLTRYSYQLICRLA